MKIVLLLEERLKPVPDSIKIEAVYDEAMIIIVDGKIGPTGEQVLLDGTPRDFEKWLRPFYEFWVGVGQTPMEQRFELSHIRG